jgi:hypothetical protein
MVCWVGLALLGALFFLSIYGAFLGSPRAKSFFNSPPLIAFWLFLTAGLLISLAVSRFAAGEPRNLGPLLMHLGAVFVLAGAMWGSEAAHNLRANFFVSQKFQTGKMVIYEGQEEKHVISESSGKLVELPFAIKLKDFRIEYYEPAYLQIQSSDGGSWTLPVEIDNEVPLAPGLGSVTVLRSFENFKIKVEGNEKIAIYSNSPGSNPALEVQLKEPNGNTTTRYVFERFSGHARPGDKFVLGYYRIPRDYISELQVVKDGKVLAEKNVEVNHPLHFGGYHFYQQSYDTDNELYTVLTVVSDSGLALVYAGYVLLCVGVFYHFWFKDIVEKRLKAS